MHISTQIDAYNAGLRKLPDRFLLVFFRNDTDHFSKPGSVSLWIWSRCIFAALAQYTKNCGCNDKGRIIMNTIHKPDSFLNSNFCIFDDAIGALTTYADINSMICFLRSKTMRCFIGLKSFGFFLDREWIRATIPFAESKNRAPAIIIDKGTRAKDSSHVEPIELFLYSQQNQALGGGILIFNNRIVFALPH